VNDSANSFAAEDTIDLRAIVARLWPKRRWIGASGIVFAALFAALAFLMTPIYRSSVVFVPANAGHASISNVLNGPLGGTLGGLASLAGFNFESSVTETQEALAVLKSRQFTEAFIDDWHLMPELFRQSWDAQRQQWKANVRVPTKAQAYKYFNKSIRSIVEDRKTGLITLQIDWRDRTEATQWANELLRRLNEEMRTRAIRRADAAIAYLEKESNATNVVATRDAISRLIEAEMKQRMVASVSDEYAFRVVDKAMAPDKDDVLKPKKIVLLLTGMVLGMLIGIAVVLRIEALGSKSPPLRTRV
jgi:uncharacterized protein involved in exopolysaccharide biosynthesis